MRISKSNWWVKWAYLPDDRGPGWFGPWPRVHDHMPNHANICVLFWRGVLRTPSFFVLALALGLFMMGLLRIVNRDRARHGPTVRRLCQAMGLDMSQRKLLVDLAAKSGQASAACLLISRGAYDAAIQQYAPIGVQASQLKTVRRKIFGE